MAASGAIRPRCSCARHRARRQRSAAFCSGVPSFSLRSRVFGAGLPGNFTREGHGASEQVAFDQACQRCPASQASSALIGLPSAHISTAFATPASRGKPLRSRRSGNDAKLHFRLADLRARRGHAIMPGHRQFQSSAKGRAMNGHHHRLGAIFNAQQHGDQIERPRCFCPR